MEPYYDIYVQKMVSCCGIAFVSTDCLLANLLGPKDVRESSGAGFEFAKAAAFVYLSDPTKDSAGPEKELATFFKFEKTDTFAEYDVYTILNEVK